MTFQELAWEFAEIFDDLDADSINEILVKNVPLETLEFFSRYAEGFGKSDGVSEATMRRLPNLMLIGYLLRVLEGRLLTDDPSDP